MIRIDQMFRLVAVVVLTVTVCGAGSLLVRDWRLYAAGNRAAVRLQALKETLKASEYLSAERGPMNALLGASPPDDLHLRAALTQARAHSDMAIARAIEMLDASASGSGRESVARLVSVRERLKLARRDIDSLLAVPRAGRSTRSVEQAIDGMFQLISDIDPVNDSIAYEITLNEPVVAEHVMTARLAAELRERAGRAGSLLTPALMHGRALTPDEFERMSEVIGRIRALGDLIASGTFGHLSGTGHAMPDLARMQRIYFGSGIAYLRQIAQRGAADDMAPTAASFAERYVPFMQPITALRDSEMRAAMRDVETRKHAALKALWMLASIVATVVLSIATLLVLFSKRIIGPISAATSSILDFAGGNYAMPVHGIDGKDQIGALLSSLGALRDALVRNVQLEEDRSTLIEQMRLAMHDSKVQAGLLEQARDAALAAAEAKGRFLALVSHELRTPMHGMLGMLEILERSELDSVQRRYLDLVLGSARALTGTLNDVLDYASVDAGAPTLACASVDLREIVDEVAAALAGNAERKGLDMEVHVHPDVAACHLADPRRLRQILLHLLSNAVKFTSRGRVGIRITPGEIDDGRQPLSIAVYDTGSGIPDAVRKDLFVPFERFDDGWTGGAGSLGIGLAISKRLTDMMGGTLEIDSLEHLGTSATLRIELAVERERYDFTSLKGRAILIDTEKLQVARALKAFALAAGMEPLERRWLADDGTASILAVTDARDQASWRSGHALRIDTYPVPRARRSHPDYWANPPGWRLFVACCEAVVAGEPESPRLSGGPAHAPGWLPSGTVLVVDDNPVNRIILADQLAKLGCDRIQSCRDGDDAWHVLSSTPVALIVTDVYMPGLDGIGLIERVRAAERSAGRRTPIVAVTASVLDEIERRCRAAGADAFLTRPISTEQLRQALAGIGGESR
ncbi:MULTISPECIES: response regulator [unclassified Burkholderia]|uniref:response regulator n=1 Tax=unclassified Burkholderia TaxID=2613784 RepID=UPI002ABE1C6B|nr:MULTISPECIES: response regulator [unclassified Burkholderia]